jgi:hypothetical protein
MNTLPSLHIAKFAYTHTRTRINSAIFCCLVYFLLPLLSYETCLIDVCDYSLPKPNADLSSRHELELVELAE